MITNKYISKLFISALALLLITVFTLRNFASFWIQDSANSVSNQTNSFSLPGVEQLDEAKSQSWVSFLMSFMSPEKKVLEEEGSIEGDDESVTHHAFYDHFCTGNTASVFKAVVLTIIEANYFVVADIKAESSSGLHIFNCALLI